MFILVVNFCYLLSQVTYAYNKFDNYTLYEVTAFNSRERAVLHLLYVKSDMIIFINGVSNEAAVPMNVIVDKCCTTFFEDKLKENDIEYIVLGNEHLVKSKEDLYINQNINEMPNLTTEFYGWDSLMLWVDSRVKKYPFIKKIKIAKTAEKRDVFALKLSSGRKNSAVFLMAGEEGRDWLPPAVLLNFVDYMLENNQLNVTLLLRHYDFYVLPFLNPDGYDYSTTRELYWARNRKVYFPKKVCAKNASTIGINLDRNWYFSKDIIRRQECDSVYAGSSSISEEETAGVARFLDTIALQMLAFINLRGFEDVVTIPYGCHNEICNNYPILLDILASVHDRVRDDYGTSFFFGSTATFFYNFTGNIADWVKKKLNTPIVYTIYMKPDDYIMPSASDIKPMTDRFSTMMKEILLLGNSIYSPLFSFQVRHLIHDIVIVINILCIFI